MPMVFFRADASVTIGSGHVMRCLTLADELQRRGAEVMFICREHAGHMAEHIRRQNIPVALLKKNGSAAPAAKGERMYAAWLGAAWDDDARGTIAVLAGRNPDPQKSWLVVDHYGLDRRWHDAVRPQVRHILAIDDLADRPLSCDLLLDQTLGREPGDYRHLVPAHCGLLLGARYALLRPQFAAYRQAALKRRRQWQGIGRLLVSLGGMDPDNLTGRVLQGLAQIRWPGPIAVDVVLTSQAPHLEEVQSLASQSALNITVCSDVTNMAELMSRADLAIGAGGTTSWERCCLALPTVLVVEAENQRKIAAELEKAGAVVVISSNALEEGLLREVAVFMKDPARYNRMAVAAAAVCSGGGAALVAERMSNYV